MIVLGMTVTFNFTTVNPATGNMQNADSLPTVAVYEDEDDVAILEPIPVNRATGEYRVAIPVTVGNGFEVGKTYNAVVAATVAGTSGKMVLAMFLVNAPVVETVIEGTLTLQDVLRVLLAYTAGLTDLAAEGADKRVKFKDVTGTKDRISGLVVTTADGNERQSITLDPS
jgi:hypothetical protein